MVMDMAMDYRCHLPPLSKSANLSQHVHIYIYIYTCIYIYTYHVILRFAKNLQIILKFFGPTLFISENWPDDAGCEAVKPMMETETEISSKYYPSTPAIRVLVAKLNSPTTGWFIIVQKINCKMTANNTKNQMELQNGTT